MENKTGKLFGNKKWVIYCIALLVGGAMGIITPLATTHMSKHGVGPIWIGIISSSFFFALVLGSIFGDRKMRGRDLTQPIITGLLMTALCDLFFPLVGNPFLWLTLMFIMGIGDSFNLVGIQTALHQLSHYQNRAMVSGIYTVCYALGFAISSVVGPMIYELNDSIPFNLSAFSLMLGAFLIYFLLKGVMVIAPHSEEKVFTKILMPLFGVFTYGFSETTLVSLYPLYLLNHNIDLSHIGYALGIFVLGGLVGAVPITYLGDKLGREKSLIVSLVISIFAIFGIILFDGLLGKLVFSFIAGFTVGPIYPLTLAMSVQHLSKKEMPSGTALFNVSYGLGSAAGPVLSSIVMGTFGNHYIFSLCLFLFALLLIGMITRRNSSSQFIYGGENQDGIIYCNGERDHR